MLPRGTFLRPVDASKCVCDRGSVPDPLGELTDPLAGFGDGEQGRGNGKG